MYPLYVAGLIGPGDRKSVQPLAERFAPGEYDRLHHFVASGTWDSVRLEAELLVQADRLVGGEDAVLVIDDTALPKKGTHSVGVAPRCATRNQACRPSGKPSSPSSCRRRKRDVPDVTDGSSTIFCQSSDCGLI